MKRLVALATTLTLVFTLSLTAFAIPTKDEVNNVNNRVVFMTLATFNESTKTLGGRVSTYDPTMSFSLTPDSSLYLTSETYLTGDKYDLIPSGYRLAIGWWDDNHTVYNVPADVKPEDEPIGIQGDGVMQDKEFIPASRTDIRNWDLSVTVKTGKNQKLVVDSTKISYDSANNAYVEFTLVNSYDATSNKDFEIELNLKCGSRNLKETAYIVSGELANQIYEAYADDTEIYLDSDGYRIVKPEEAIRNATIFLEYGVELRKCNLSKGREYFARAYNDFTSQDETIINDIPEIEEIIHLKTINIPVGVEVWLDYPSCYVYGLASEGSSSIGDTNSSLVELGQTNKALPLRQTYYVTSKAISADKLNKDDDDDDGTLKDTEGIDNTETNPYNSENNQTYVAQTTGVRTYDTELKNMNGKVLSGTQVKTLITATSNRELAVLVRSKALQNTTLTNAPWSYNYNAILMGAKATEVKDVGKAYGIPAKLASVSTTQHYSGNIRTLYSAVTYNSNYGGLDASDTLQYIAPNDGYIVKLVQNSSGYFSGVALEYTTATPNYNLSIDEPNSLTPNSGDDYMGPNHNPATGRPTATEMWEYIHKSLEEQHS